MLRKMLTLGAVALVAVAFGVGSATASKAPSSSAESSSHLNGDGFSDGRLAG
jgi:hypothetical protein